MRLLLVACGNLHPTADLRVDACRSAAVDARARAAKDLEASAIPRHSPRPPRCAPSRAPPRTLACATTLRCSLGWPPTDKTIVALPDADHAGLGDGGGGRGGAVAVAVAVVAAVVAVALAVAVEVRSAYSRPRAACGAFSSRPTGAQQVAGRPRSPRREAKASGAQGGAEEEEEDDDDDDEAMEAGANVAGALEDRRDAPAPPAGLGRRRRRWRRTRRGDCLAREAIEALKENRPLYDAVRLPIVVQVERVRVHESGRGRCSA